MYMYIHVYRASLYTVRVKKNFPYPFRLTGGPFKKQGNERTLNGNRKEDERMEPVPLYGDISVFFARAPFT